ncbi:poly [ADP-ribose] polymerase 1 [Cynara cardunculus var. scolymus]|uniref:poly [ADP-ribose] polymerase 1 n=1 Tax=Cynara cardunculus var. scolymus TaxID=59895 RepID=UPI000D62CDE6|nr:poly [ADP-ribose] polymerase 1 [Cynara cardunculus var. scolymus]
MATPPKPWKAEYAKSGRSSCKACKKPIDKETLRLGKMIPATQFDGFMPMWHHAECILKKAKQIKSTDDVEGIETLRWEDQQKIRQYVEGGGGGGGSPSTPAPSATKCTIEASKTARATCKICNEKILTGEVRISSKPEGQGARGLAWHHAKCFMDASPTTQLEKVVGWENLSDSDKATVGSLVKKVPANKKGKDEVKEEKETLKQSSKRKGSVGHDQKSKMAKIEGDPSTPETPKCGNNSGDRELEPSKLHSLLEAQAKELWALKDDLKKSVSTVELREMLEANNQDSSGSELDLRDRCADGMLFGPLENCPLCSGHLHYSGGTYKCKGFLTEWSKCAYSTSEPERVKGKWNIPQETKNQYLMKWFKTQKVKKPVRIMPPPSSSTPGKSAVNGTTQSSHSEKLGDLKVCIMGVPSKTMDEWKTRIESVGGQVHVKIKKDTNCLVVSGAPENQNAEMRKARRMKIPIVREDYLVDCFKRQKKLRFDLYKIETSEEAKSMVTVKVKGRSAVHEASGLQDTGHILEHGKSIYNTTLSLSDLSTGVNSYYILQIIEDDKGSNCHVFRKWGRVGNEKIGGIKLEEMSKADAIQEFKRLFLDKTGNTWEAWEQKKLQKQPGRFYPLDIDYGVNKDSHQKNKVKDAKSQLAPPLAELMKMLFNVETYRAAMMEFEINMAEMPLGKLSKSNIQKGFEVLTELQNLLNKAADNPAVKESMIVDASNRFFTVIPSVHPHVIKDEDDFKSKVKMLEALQDIEIASRLVGFDVDNDDSLDDKYKKLQCEMVPLPHDSEDYRLVEKYLQTTHAPTHTDWALELEEVFTVERRGEFDKFAPYKDKLKNKMLLWHGSRLTNFVGILSQGLRIAPPEAPATGYMFGKGIYFADLVSKSAQYCFTDKKNPVGLMLLSEVALGEMHELKKAKYMDKPPKGKDSTKGLGKKIPNESEHVKWKDDVVVPCGKPVSSNVKASELMYNEYIVYNANQVKLQFLLKVRFHHKR